MLDHQIAWYIAGPVVGLCVVVWRLLYNARLGAVGAFTDVIDKVRQRRLDFDWRGWCAIGIVAGAAAFTLVNGGPNFTGYGWLTATFHGSWQVLIAPILLVSGVAIGYGAKLAGGCTSGNGLSGVSALSLASLAATATFFATAIAVTAIVEVLR